MGKSVKRIVVLLMAVAMIMTGMLTGCGSTSTDNATTNGTTVAAGTTAAATTAAVTTAAAGPKTVINFWYLWSNAAEIKVLTDAINAYNSSQNKYVVKGITKDEQATTVAMAGGSGPDVADSFDYKIAGYSDTGIIEPLDDYIAKTSYDMSDFIPMALSACQYKGKTYGLPISVTTYMLFYNKKMFADAGLSEPPKTDKEMLQDAILLTKVNADKSIAVMGYPDYPFVYFNTPMTFALGGDFRDASGKLTPDNIGTLTGISNAIEYRKKFGAANVTKFDSSCKYMDPKADPFVAGKQAMRIDGPWFGNYIKNTAKADIDYGLAPFPYPDGKPELANGGSLEASIIYIAATSKNKDGAWDFISYFAGKDNILNFDSLMANIPARKSLISDPKITQIPDFDAFGAYATGSNLKIFPKMANQVEYQNIMTDQINLAIDLKKPVDQALKDAAAKAANLKQ